MTLKIPKMPIVFLGNKEWFPIEFLAQCFGKMKGANSTEHVKAKLDYYKEHAGTNYVRNVSEVMQATSQLHGLSIDDILLQFNLRKSTEPVQLEAKVAQVTIQRR